MRGPLSNMQNTNQLSSVSCPSASVALFISIHSWDSTRAVMAASGYILFYWNLMDGYSYS